MVVVSKDVKGNALGCSYYLDNNLHAELKSMQRLTEKNWDAVGFIVGYEGDGKTTLGMQAALFLDNKFNLDNIVFNPTQFEWAVDNLPAGSTILWDEADDLGANWANEMLLAIKKKFKRIRSKNLKILLCTPTFHDINKYFAIVRTRFLIHVYATGLERGHFRFFGRDKKKYLYIKGKQFMDLGAVMSDFYGKFVNYPKDFPIDLEAYEDKKQEATEQIISLDRPKDIRKDVYLNFLEWVENKDLVVSRKEQAAIFDVNERTLQRYDQQERQTPDMRRKQKSSGQKYAKLT